MGEKFKDIIEDIKKSDVNPKDTKRYILAIKRVIKQAYESCKDELSQEQIIEQYLDEYDKDLEFRGNANLILYNMSKYDAYKRVLQDFEDNKPSFNKIVEKAKQKETIERGKMIENFQNVFLKCFPFVQENSS